MRVAAIDLGTNSTRLLVADIDDRGELTEIVRRPAITRLGEGADTRHRLLPLPIARVRNVLSDYRRQLEALGAAARPSSRWWAPRRASASISAACA